MYFPLIIWLSMYLPFADELKLMETDIDDSIKTVLILGDSHLVGDFGDALHREMHRLKKYNVVSVGIGGAGSYHFTGTMRTFCCGSIIRETCIFDSISDQVKIPVTEKSDGPSNSLVGKFFKGKLSNFISHYEPEIVIVALGSNYTNAHEELMKILRNGNINREVIWVGPMRRSNMEIRLNAIRQVMIKYPDIRFISSEDIVGHDTITSAHYSGKAAKYWAEKVVKKMAFFIR